MIRTTFTKCLNSKRIKRNRKMSKTVYKPINVHNRTKVVKQKKISTRRCPLCKVKFNKTIEKTMHLMTQCHKRFVSPHWVLKVWTPCFSWLNTRHSDRIFVRLNKKPTLTLIESSLLSEPSWCLTSSSICSWFGLARRRNCSDNVLVAWPESWST